MKFKKIIKIKSNLNKLKKHGRGVICGLNTQFRLPQYISIGKNVNLGDYSLFFCWDEYAGKKLAPALIIKDGVKITRNCTVYCTNKIEIGKNVLIASNVLITDENHGMDPESGPYIEQPLLNSEVIIGDDVWIGEQCCVLPGAKIGKKSIVGANSVVNKEIPAYCIAAGNPAKVIKIWDSEKKLWRKI
ncbi:lipopolysaccharide O-acetyltransferase [Eubacterium maltosivorans]|uniref:acyltransferase n=1 Tax=Eubacterium maltosivorans TaxID=2041044 RepID=UPI00088CCF3B|nr:acyltransferase [Eubacterium maltosivorans]WPK80055.1 2,3,4,5-tetrahydropyridine-2,6-dicarboxylate N-acetyltransferase [Eubacterium maltosivorans]SDP87466.1 lipopolysaccharide O-acetyltransferase [Eubacterium maltosivorans]